MTVTKVLSKWALTLEPTHTGIYTDDQYVVIKLFDEDLRGCDHLIIRKKSADKMFTVQLQTEKWVKAQLKPIPLPGG